MKQRGRKSPESQAVAIIDNPVEVPRPDAPYDLTDAEVDEWRAVVNRLPADHFPRETHPLLTQWCRLTVSARFTAKLRENLERQEKIDIGALTKVMNSEQQTTKTLAMLSMRLRLAPQAIFESRKKNPVMIEKPWDRYGT